MSSSSRPQEGCQLLLCVMLVALYACEDETAADIGGDAADRDLAGDPEDAAESDTSDSAPNDLDDPLDVETDETTRCEPTATVICPCDEDETSYCCDGGGQVYHCNVDGYWSQIDDAYCGMSEFPENIVCPWRQH